MKSNEPINLSTVFMLCLILLGIGLRILGIDNPPFDHHHIRQADTTSIAMLMQHHPKNFLWPKIGWAGAGGGLVESELPLYSALTAAGWQILPESGPIWPRTLSIVSWLFGGLGLYHWTRTRIKGAMWPHLLLYALSPIAIITSRNVQPDSLALALLIWGFALIDRPKVSTVQVILGGAITGLGIAAKGQYFVFLPMIPILMWWHKASSRAPFFHIGLCTGIALTLPALWYAHAHFNLAINGATFGVFGANAQKWGSPELWTDSKTWMVLGGMAIKHVLTPLGTGLTVFAFFMRDSSHRPFWLGCGFAVLSWGILTHGHLLHNYYQLPLVPFASILIGYGLKAVWTQQQKGMFILGLILLLFSAVESRRFVLQALKIDETIMAQASEINDILPPKVPIVLVTTHPQTVLFASGRTGAIANRHDPSRTSDYAEMGLRYAVIHKDHFRKTDWTNGDAFKAHGQWWVHEISAIE